MNIERFAWLDLAVPQGGGLNNGIRDSKSRVEATASGPLKAIEVTFKRVQCAFYSRFTLSFCKRFARVQAAFYKGGELASHLYCATEPLIDIFRNAVLSGEQLLEPVEIFPKIAKYTHLFSFISTPISLVTLGRGGLDLTSSLKAKDYVETAEQLLNVAAGLSDLSLGISACMDGMIAAAFIKTSAALTTVSTYLTGVGAILSLAAVGLQAKFIHESRNLKQRIVKAAQVDFQAVIAEINKESDTRVARKIGVIDGGKLKARLKAIYRRSRDKNENLTGTVQALKNRIKWNTIGHALKMTAAVISIIAVGVFLLSPLAPLGYGLLALTAAIGLAVLLMDYRSEKVLSSYLKQLAPDESPEMKNYLDRRKWQKDFLKDPYIHMWDAKAKLISF